CMLPLNRRTLLAVVSLLVSIPRSGATQGAPIAPRAKTGGSPNVKLLGHLPLDGYFAIGGVDIEQEVSRPFVYISGMNDKPGFTVASVADPSNPRVIYRWNFPRTERDSGLAGENG